MRLSAHYGWPIEVQGDTRRDYPTRIDGPRTDGIDAKVFEAMTRGLKTAVVSKGADQSGIASGGPAGFTATLTGVPIGAPVIGLISHVGGVSIAGVVFFTAAWTGGTGAGLGPQYTAPTGWWQLMYAGHCIATSGTVSLTYSLATSGGATWTCHQRSTIVLVTL